MIYGSVQHRDRQPVKIRGDSDDDVASRKGLFFGQTATGRQQTRGDVVDVSLEVVGPSSPARSTVAASSSGG